jgi:hypothetical protein
MLWLYQRVFYGEVNPEVRARVPDLSLREWAAVVPLIVMMVWMGVYSQSFLPPVGKTTALVLEQSQVNVPFRVGIPVRSPLADAHGSIQSRDREGAASREDRNRDSQTAQFAFTSVSPRLRANVSSREVIDAR